MKKLLSTVAIALVLAGPALATQCPMLMGQIDEALKTASVDEATKAQVMALYDEGKAAHEAGDHPTSEAKLHEALALLGM
jgi:hypothetical protein